MTSLLLLESGFDPVAIVAASGGVAKATLAILGVMSVAAWALWGSRRLAVGRLTRETRQARETLVRVSDPEALADAGRSLPEGPARRLFLAAAPEYRDVLRSWSAAGRAPSEAQVDAGRELLARTLAGARSRELLAARRGLTPLATIGSTAPFIGLFGTVWGVIDSFESIGGAGSASLAVVAPGVAEALVATGAGLVAAVPAVWFYNGLAGALRRFANEIEGVGAEVLNVYDRTAAAGGAAPAARAPAAAPQSAWDR